MLRRLGIKCTELLIHYHSIQEKEKPIYIYGFELFWSTFLCVVTILFWGVIFRYVLSSMIFILFFMPIRTVAGGYHASSYGKCYCLTNCIALVCVLLSKAFNSFCEPGVISASLLLVVIVYIWRTAPVQAGMSAQEERTLARNKKYSHVLLCIAAPVVILLRSIGNGELYYTATITTCIVAIMMFAVKKERRRENG